VVETTATPDPPAPVESAPPSPPAEPAPVAPAAASVAVEEPAKSTESYVKRAIERAVERVADHVAQRVARPVAAKPPVPAPAEVPVVALPATATPVSDLPAQANDRPTWVGDSGGKLVNTIYSVSIHSGLYATVPECQGSLNREVKREADHYIEDYLGEGAASIVKIPLPYLLKHVKKAEYNEVVNSETVGPMQQIHWLLEFDDSARADFHRLWHEAIVTNRLLYAGSGAALVLALLGTFYGYLKLDLQTGGAHKGRLQLAATLVALIVAAGALVVRWAVPF
jgi:hypothetical protein